MKTTLSEMDGFRITLKYREKKSIKFKHIFIPQIVAKNNILNIEKILEWSFKQIVNGLLKDISEKT